MNNLSKNLLSIPRYFKQAIVIINDIVICILCTWLAFSLILEEFILFNEFNFYPAFLSIIFAIPIFWLFGLYRTIFRYFGLPIIFTVLISTFIYGFLYFSLIGVYTIQGVPRSIGILQPMLMFFFITYSRLTAGYILTSNFYFTDKPNKQNILIYGAGSAGRQLVFALENSHEFKVIGMLDDNVHKHKKTILGLNIYAPSRLQNLVQSKNIRFVFLALPRINRIKRNQIIENLSQHKLIVKTLPSIAEIVGGRITISDIKDLNVYDLLNRDEVKPDMKLLNKNIHLKTVLVTGAGGSIGSELCRQIIRLKPNKLIILEISEYALYKIYEELIGTNKNLKIISLLANVQDQSKLEKIFETFNVDTVYHAAAYKHVSLVEENVCEGVKNNVFGTLAVAKAVIKTKVSNLVFISSDKAVRPTNVMGASKRLSELCIQGIYNQANSNTNFAIVRFGNVLESSGSVIPKFKKQIKEGSAITLTHKNVTRYFMTVTEAAQLVIQAGAMGKSAEVFVLDMGESIKINDLANKLIKLSGLTVKDDKNIDGDIEIKVTGLKPGEKLYEELLIGVNPQPTNHSKIKKASDTYIPFDKLEVDLKILNGLLNNNKVKEVKSMLVKLSNSYKSNVDIVDQIYVKQLSNNNNQQNSLLKKDKVDNIIKK